jgi:hypothetical protein
VIYGPCLWADEASAEEEAVRAKQEGIRAYANAEVVVALSGWEDGAELPVAEGCLKALKRLLESEKDLPGTTFENCD